MVFRAFLEQRRSRPSRGRAHLGSLVLHGAVLLALALAARRIQQSDQAPLLLPPPVLAVTLVGPRAALAGTPGPRGSGAAAPSRPSVAAPASQTARKRPPRARRPPLPHDRPAPATQVALASEPPAAAPGSDGPMPIGLALGGAEGDGDGGGGGAIRGRRPELFARVIGGGVAPESPARRDRPFLTVKEATALRTQDYFPRLPAALWPERGPYVVVVELCVSEQGRVSEAELLSRASDRLDPVVLAAVRGWRYRPHLESGIPRPFCHGVVIKYERHY